jgi:hypothetical protein
MSDKKACVACAKQIPSVALVCVFCSATQPASDPELAASDSAASASAASDSGLSDDAVAATAASPSDAAAPAVVSRHATDPTMMGIRVADLEAANPSNGVDHRASTAAGDVPPVLATSESDGAAAARGATADAPAEVTFRDAQLPTPNSQPPAEPWAPLGRFIMALGGAVLVALFFCPWHGVSSWQLLETLTGADFVRQLFYLTGGIVLLAAAILPLPFVFRATVGTLVGAMPVLLGAGGVLEGWRGVVATLAVVGLPAAHLLRARAQRSPTTRLLVLAAVAAVLLLYLVPSASVVPIAAVFKMMGSGAMGAVLGLFVLIPLVFAGLSLLGVLGRDLTDIGVLLSVLILLWAPAGVALRGLLIEDATQFYVGVGLLWASGTAALSLAQLLSAAARPRAS